MGRPRKGETQNKGAEIKSGCLGMTSWIWPQWDRRGLSGDRNVHSRYTILDGSYKTLVWSLGQGDPLEGEMADRPSIPAWESQGQRSLAGYSPQGCRELDTTEPACRGGVYTAIRTHQTEHLGSVSYVQIILTIFKNGERFIYSALKRR